MRKLRIVDLGFCESELVSNSQVLGGTGTTITVTSPYGTWSSSYDTAKYSGYSASYYVDPQTGQITTQISGVAEGGVAGAVAGVVSDGVTKYAYSSSSVKV
ncbi:hypothetical protein G7B40_002435 [Aetokthonos hydrillicola Thurmond2011]|jgi:hypothetical protein|uniref:Uncharacterized protein n=1 Tax=Aetokthonos hydrillicola Thurmond2011 TaxID=2712845 RepID=A0AAP5I2F4_9CYAN|nr:hypothetical protein [Aetokthonos hydrillicola]MBO3464522.1 hypothetical protein [Aetokthonos hydrillicola CCALA 1050]MBW4588132.1 hypothetical protein [Aetokthonos hydrillicola CCALA 1050]MDR9893446.1 hypothetical protein [Aetokthonos hydrillicola Thurmond2011]